MVVKFNKFWKSGVLDEKLKLFFYSLLFYKKRERRRLAGAMSFPRLSFSEYLKNKDLVAEVL